MIPGEDRESDLLLRNPDRKQAPGLLRSAGVISLAVALSRITGLIRESILGWLFGASATFDAYVLGYRIPMLSRELLAEGALSAAFVPTFTRYLATKDHAAAQELVNIAGTLTLLAATAVCVVGVVGAPWFVDLFAPGFASIPGKRDLAITLTRIMFPFLLFVSISAQAQGVLNANHRFGLPALSSCVFNIISVAAGLVIGHFTSMGSVFGMATGVLVGGVAQTCFLLPVMWRTGFTWRPQFTLRNEGIRQIAGLMGPSLLGTASLQINVLVNTNLAAGIRDASGYILNGPVSWLSYALRFFALPVGLFAVAIASATLPRLSRSAALQDMEDFRQTLVRSLTAVFLLALPSTAGLIVLGESMIAIVYQRGRFLAYDTHQTALALSCYACGLAGAGGMKLLVPAFYALGDARTPMLVSLASIGINAAVGYSLIHAAGMRHAAIALASAAVASTTCLSLILLIRSRIGGIEARALLMNALKIVVASLATAVACGLVKLLSHAVLVGKSAYMVDVAAGVPTGVLAFYFCGSLLSILGLDEFKSRFAGLTHRLTRK